MNRKMVAEEIKRRVTIDQVLAAYGYRAKRGRMMCPFHADRNASLQIYAKNNSWYCFGCQKGGSVIDFVTVQEGCTFQQALQALDETFRLHLTDAEDPLDMDRAAGIRREIDRLAALMNKQLDALDEYHEAQMKTLTQMSSMIYSKRKQDLTDREWTMKLQLDDAMERIEYKMQQCREAREEVRQWTITKYREHLTSRKTTARSHKSGAQSA